MMQHRRPHTRAQRGNRPSMRRLLLVSAVFLLAALVAVGTQFSALVLWAMRPAGPFDAATLPAAPDYAQPSMWTALPDRADEADVFLPAFPASDQANAPADVFYIHPTTYVGPAWNAPVDDAVLNAATDRVATRLQASAFNACCAVYGPRYRQTNGLPFTQPSADGQRALDVAYQDVVAAFRVFLASHNRSRPFFLAAHSQGSFLAQRLVREEISGHPAAARLVAAYLPGAPWPLDVMQRDAPDLPPCAMPNQTGCLVSWNARGPNYQRGAFEFPLEGAAPPLCVNPLTWRTDGAPAPAAANQGAVFFDAPQPLMMPAFASAQCRDGTLVVDQVGKAPRDFMSSLLDRALGAGNHHPIEYQMYFVDLRANALERARAFVARRAP